MNPVNPCPVSERASRTITLGPPSLVGTWTPQLCHLPQLGAGEAVTVACLRAYVSLGWRGPLFHCQAPIDRFYRNEAAAGEAQWSPCPSPNRQTESQGSTSSSHLPRAGCESLRRGREGARPPSSLPQGAGYGRGGPVGRHGEVGGDGGGAVEAWLKEQARPGYDPEAEPGAGRGRGGARIGSAEELPLPPGAGTLAEVRQLLSAQGRRAATAASRADASAPVSAARPAAIGPQPGLRPPPVARMGRASGPRLRPLSAGRPANARGVPRRGAQAAQGRAEATRACRPDPPPAALGARSLLDRSKPAGRVAQRQRAGAERRGRKVTARGGQGPPEPAPRAQRGPWPAPGGGPRRPRCPEPVVGDEPQARAMRRTRACPRAPARAAPRPRAAPGVGSQEEVIDGAAIASFSAGQPG